MNAFVDFIRLTKSDLSRYGKPFFYAVMFVPGYKYTFHHRLCHFLSEKKILLPLFLVQWLYLKHLSYLFGIEIDWRMKLPEGFFIAHFGGITFVPKKCGKNLFLRQNVTVGSDRDDGGTTFCPEIGDNVTFGANSIAIGPIKIGNNVYIGASSLVNKDVPDNCVVAGIPAKIIKHINHE